MSCVPVFCNSTYQQTLEVHDIVVDELLALDLSGRELALLLMLLNVVVVLAQEVVVAVEEVLF